MPGGAAYIQWDSYKTGPGGRGFFLDDPLAFNSRQERLHSIGVGQRLWLVSRCPDDSQHYVVGVLRVRELRHNRPESKIARSFGEFAIVGERDQSLDLRTRFPADGLLRALEFETGKPIKFGASIGQSLQTIRLLSPADERVLDCSLQRILGGRDLALDAPFGLWTKCDGVFADYFWQNWRARRQPLAFLLYDSPPTLPNGAPVFIHSDKNLRLLGAFRGIQYVTGYKPTADADERIFERERVWTAFREPTLNPPSKTEFDRFWDSQHGVRSLFIMDNLVEVPVELPFKTYGRALEWGYPMGVGYRYLTLSQCWLLLRATELIEEVRDTLMEPLLRA